MVVCIYMFKEKKKVFVMYGSFADIIIYYFRSIIQFPVFFSFLWYWLFIIHWMHLMPLLVVLPIMGGVVRCILYPLSRNNWKTPKGRRRMITILPYSFHQRIKNIVPFQNLITINFSRTLVNICSYDLILKSFDILRLNI